MNRKGFTLIEVIMVIAIIAILSIILAPNVMVLINKNNERSCEKLIDNIKSAAKMYVNQNKYELGFDCDDNKTKGITLETLVDAGYLTGDILKNKEYPSGYIVNPVGNTKIDLKRTTVSVTYNCGAKSDAKNDTEGKVKGFEYTVNNINCN